MGAFPVKVLHDVKVERSAFVLQFYTFWKILSENIQNKNGEDIRKMYIEMIVSNNLIIAET